jgi:PleD family two-component response regulator
LCAAIEEHFKYCKYFIAALGGIGNVLRMLSNAATCDLRAGHSDCSDQRRNLKQEWTRRLTNQWTVLYVDDNPKARRMLTLALERTGYKVVTASNGEALARMKCRQMPR